MEIRSRRVGSTTVIDVSGALVIGPNAAAFRQAIESSGARRVVMNFSQVTRLDCAGISELVRVHCAFARERRSLLLVEVQPRQRRLLALCGLDRVLSTFTTEQEAVAEPVSLFMTHPPTSMAFVGLR